MNIVIQKMCYPYLKYVPYKTLIEVSQAPAIGLIFFSVSYKT